MMQNSSDTKLITVENIRLFDIKYERVLVKKKMTTERF